MADIGFYHLTRSTAEQALPRLLGRVLDLGQRALVLVGEADRVAAIDEALWRAPEPVWLPHGTARLGHAALQPIWIAQGSSEQGDSEAVAPNGARFLFLLDGVQSTSLDRYERVFDLFNGGQEAELTAARARWSACRQAGHITTYWRQQPRGWEKAG